MIQEYLEIADQQYSVGENTFIYGSALAARGVASAYGGSLLAAKVGAEAAAGAIGYFTDK